jgi:glyceraldehyde-3-phosphate dehydrogenase (NADP+)
MSADSGSGVSEGTLPGAPPPELPPSPLAPPTRPLWIGGQPRRTEREDPVRSPETSEVVALVSVADHQLREQATVAALEAFAVLRAWPRHRRRTLCQATADGIAARRMELAEMIQREAAKPIRLAEGEVSRAELVFRLAAEEATRATAGESMAADVSPATEAFTLNIERFARGPVLGISPFNFPLNLAAHKIAPALACGCSIVLKAPPQAPSAALLLAQICSEAGAPPGAVSVLHAPVEVAEALVADDRFTLVSFTGSARVGWQIKARAGKKPVLLELGGNAGAVVHQDADLDWAVERSVQGAFAYAGQICISLQRLLVHRPVFDRVAALLEERTASISRLPFWGQSLLPECVGSHLIDDGAAGRVLSWVDEARERGARSLAGAAGEGSLVQPTLLCDVDHQVRVWREEVFGPVLVVEPYEDFDAALGTLNDSPYGLQASVFTRDIGRIQRAFRTLEVGGLVANDFPLVRVDSMPYGGVKESGLGREGLRDAIWAMTEPRVLLIRS